MEIFDALMAGFATAATPANLLWALVGCALGTAVGVLPGIGPAVAVAMLLPITAKVEVTASMIFFAGIYYGAMYGGSTTSILLNTPGETASMVTAMEGNKMAKSGRAGQALATAAICSFVAGTIAKKMAITDLPQMVSQQQCSGGVRLWHRAQRQLTSELRAAPLPTWAGLLLVGVVGTVAACSANTAALTGCSFPRQPCLARA